MNFQNLDNNVGGSRLGPAASSSDLITRNEDGRSTRPMPNNIDTGEKSPKKSKKKKIGKSKRTPLVDSPHSNEEEDQPQGQRKGSSTSRSQLELAPPIDESHREDVSKPKNTPKTKKRKSNKKLSAKKLDNGEEERHKEASSRLKLAPAVYIDDNNREETDKACAESDIKSKKKKKRKSSKRSSKTKLDYQPGEEEEDKEPVQSSSSQLVLAPPFYRDDDDTHGEKEKHEDDSLFTETKKCYTPKTVMKKKRSSKKMHRQTKEENFEKKDGSPPFSNQNSEAGHRRHRPRARVPDDDDAEIDDYESIDPDEMPGAHRIPGRDAIDNDDTITSQPDAIEEGEEQPVVDPTATEYSSEHRVLTAELVDEEALEREFADRKTGEIRNQILSDAAAATEVKREKTPLQKYGVFSGCALIAIAVAIILGTTQGNNNQDPVEGYDYLLGLLSSVSNKTLLLNETTPQFEALNWLAFEDTSGIPLLESNSQALEKEVVERYVLALLYLSTGGSNWTNSYSFLSNSSICEWSSSMTDDNEASSDGIRCNDGGFVDSISLDSNNLDGSLPYEIQQLDSLQSLRLTNNGLRGTLPEAMGDMPNLRQLFLNQNLLTGEIPESFGGLLGLEIVSLWRNSLEGTIPSVVTSLPRLEEMFIGGNFFTGSIPDFLPRGPMKIIKVGFNFLSGSIPGTIYQLSSLEQLDLNVNDVTGSISSNIGNLVSLKRFLVWMNSLTGEIPSQVGMLEDLEVLDVGTNWLSYTIPTELGEFARLEELILEENTLTGTIPSELQHLSSLWNLKLSSNQLSGSVPLELAHLESLRDGVVFLHNNSLSGSLDSVFCNEDEFRPPIALSADCEEVECTCCTDCCNDEAGECTIDVGQFCERKLYEAELFLDFESWGTMCGCRDGENEDGAEGGDGLIHVECSDSCVSCNSEGNFCLEKYDYGFDISKSTGLDNLFECNMRYIPDNSAPYRNEEITYRIDYAAFECSLLINGTPCSSCLADRICADGFEGLFVDCSNIIEDAVYDDCSPSLDGGELLQFLRPEYFQQDCIPCLLS